jgi:hypothetical protein
MRYLPIVLVALLSAGCGPTPPAASPRLEPAAAAATSATPRGPAPLNATELGYEEELRRDVTHLAGKIGERNADKKWELADATDWLAGELEKAGYTVHREGHEIDGVAAQNLEVEVRGARSGGEIVVVGAHFDSARGSPGANDNASGVAAVLSLARRFRAATPDRTLRFVLFVNEEPPYFQTENMGSLLYAKAALGRGDHVVAMLSLESLGIYSDAPGSQRYPKELEGRFPRVGNFIAVVGNPASKDLVDLVSQGLSARSSIAAEGAALPEDVPGVGWSDHWSFWQVRVPAVMVTDTAEYRDAHYHRATDTAERLDYARMARVVAGLESVIAELTGDAGLAPAPNRTGPVPSLE